MADRDIMVLGGGIEERDEAKIVEEVTGLQPNIYRSRHVSTS
jgi:hypothetical protein